MSFRCTYPKFLILNNALRLVMCVTLDLSSVTDVMSLPDVPTNLCFLL